MESHALRLRGLLKVTDALLQRHEPGLYLALGLRERASERERERETHSTSATLCCSGTSLASISRAWPALEDFRLPKSQELGSRDFQTPRDACANLRWAGRSTQAASTALTSIPHQSRIPKPAPNPNQPDHTAQASTRARTHAHARAHTLRSRGTKSSDAHARAHTLRSRGTKSSAGGKETAPRRPLPVQAVRFGSGAMRQTGRHRHRRQQRRRNAADVQGAELGLISCSRAALGARHQPQNQHTVAENAEQVQLNPRGRQRAPLQQPCATGGSCKHGSGRSPALQSSIAQETLP